jgi:response regulator RpfG family c-di-GMP phosphodiesterase
LHAGNEVFMLRSESGTPLGRLDRFTSSVDSQEDPRARIRALREFLKELPGVLSVRCVSLVPLNKTLEQLGLEHVDETAVRNMNGRGVFLPSASTGGEPEAVGIILTGSSAETLVTHYQAELAVAASKLRDIVEIARLQRSHNAQAESLRAQSAMNARLVAAAAELKRTQITAIRSLARLAEYRDKETGDHLQRIRRYTSLLSEEVYRRQPYCFRIGDGYSEDLSVSSMLHDIGKVAVPDSVLLKPGPLNSEEWRIMKRHTFWGWEILSQADLELGAQSYLTMASAIALHHHEWYDGSGYPSGCTGEDIPLSARVEAVADVYDALTGRRPYKEPWTHEDAIAEILRLSGRQFDPVLIHILTDIQEQFREIRAEFPD